MENNFDIKKYLVENKMTRNSRLLNEAYEIYDDEDNVVSSLPDEVTLDENKPDNFNTWKQELISLIKSNTDLEDNEISIDNSQIEKYFHDGKTPEEVYFDEWQEDYGNFRSIDEQESSIEDKLMAQLDESAEDDYIDYDFEVGDKVKINNEIEGTILDVDGPYLTIRGENDEIYHENANDVEKIEELDEMDFDSLDEEINAILEMDEISSKSKIAKFNDADSYHKASYWGNEEGADITNVDNQEKTITFTGDGNFFKELGATISYSDPLSEEDALYTMDEFDENLN